MSEFNLSVDGISSNTLGKNNKSKKECLKEKLDKDHLRQIRDKWKGKKLSLDIKFRLNINTPQPSEYEKDLDNLPKIPIDIIFGSKNDIEIFEIHSCKELVYDEAKSGFDLKISEFKPHEQKSNILIPNEKIKDGVYLTRDYAKYFLDQSKKLYYKEEYQASIPFAILAFEETTKLAYLFYSMNDKKNILENEWHKLNRHKFKSTGWEKEQKKNLEESSDSEFDRYADIIQKLGISTWFNREVSIIAKDREIKLQRKFSKIKEMCLYVDWNTDKGWISFQNIPIEDQKIINFVLISRAESRVLHTNGSIENFEKNNNTITDITSATSSKITQINNMLSTKELKKYDNKLTNEEKEMLRNGIETIEKYFPD